MIGGEACSIRSIEATERAGEGSPAAQTATWRPTSRGSGGGGGGVAGSLSARLGRTPPALFDDYLAERKVDDPRLTALFAELLETAAAEERAEGAEGADAA